MPTDDAEYESGEQQQGRKCRACGNIVVGVDDESEETMMALHVLENHEDEAEPELIEQCEEVLGR